MEIKATSLGMLIYAALLCYGVALLVRDSKRLKLSDMLFAAGFVFNAAAVIYRWASIGHLSMQTMFEVFLWLTALVYPLSLFSRKYIKSDTASLDLVIAIILTFPAGFVFTEDTRLLPPALQCSLFGPHVAAYMLSYILMFKAAAISVSALFHTGSDNKIVAEQNSYKLVCLGFPLLTLGLILGCFWAKIAWGRFWGWDPKELWSLVSWLAFVEYFHYRYKNGIRHITTNHILVITGMLFIVITLVWVNLSKIFAGLHNYAS